MPYPLARMTKEYVIFYVKERCLTWPQWVELLPKVNLGPSSRHLFTIPQTEIAYSHMKLNMYPDGGIVSLLSTLRTMLTGCRHDSVFMD
jgi:allantoicase